MRLLLVVALTAARADAPRPAGADCEGPTPGAASWFAGDLVVADGVVGGTERWFLLPNRRWAATGATECEITWTVTGTVAPPGKCAGCALSIRVHAEPDRTGSGCPHALVHGRASPTGAQVGGEANAFDEHYDVSVAADGTAKVFFAQSGRELGAGRFADGRLEYVSPRQCKWF